MSPAGFATPEEHLSAELDRADGLLRALLALSLAETAEDADPLRWGLSEVTPVEVSQYLAHPRPPDRPDFEAVPPAMRYLAEARAKRQEIDNRLRASRSPGSVPLARLTHRFGLSPLEVDALLLLALSERQEAHRRIVAYLHDNGARCWFSPQLLARALGLAAPAALLAPGARLLRHKLIEVDTDRQQVRIDPRVLSFLDGATQTDPGLDDLLVDPIVHAAPPDSAEGKRLRALARSRGAWRGGGRQWSTREFPGRAGDPDSRNRKPPGHVRPRRSPREWPCTIVPTGRPSAGGATDWLRPCAPRRRSAFCAGG